MASADILPECSTCKAILDGKRAPQGRLEKRHRLSATEMRSYESQIERIRIGGVRHEIVGPLVLGTYSTDWNCSYFEHAHRDGLLVRSICGKLLSIGKDCAKKFLGGYSEVALQLDAADKLEAERALQRTEPQRLVQSFRALVATVQRRLKAVDDLNRALPTLARAMVKAYTMSTRAVDVPVRVYDPRTGDTIERMERVPLAGTMIFGNPNRLKIAQLKSVAAENYAQRMAELELTVDNFAVAADDRTKLLDQERELKRWIDDAAQFWTESNLKSACYHAYGKRVVDEVVIDGPTIIVRATGERIGIDGSLSAAAAHP